MYDLMKKIRFWVSVGIAVFLLVVACEQVWKYFQLRSRIGTYAYGASYALRNLGKPGRYVGRVVDFRWNASPSYPGDIKGFQPRYLIARETVPGSTESCWLCTYMVTCATKAPAKYQPSPFPPITDVVLSVP